MIKNNKGFSLIDVVCAMAILALVALPICSGFLTAAQTNEKIKAKTEIYSTLNNELTKILATGVVEYPDEHISIKSSIENGNYEYAKPLSGKNVEITLIPKQAISDPGKIAYVEVVIEYEDVFVSGVWVE